MTGSVTNLVSFLSIFFFLRHIFNTQNRVPPVYAEPLTLRWEVGIDGRVLVVPDIDFSWVTIRCSCDRNPEFRAFHVMVPAQNASDPGLWLEQAQIIGPGQRRRLRPDPTGGLSIDMKGRSYWDRHRAIFRACPGHLHRDPLVRSTSL